MFMKHYLSAVIFSVIAAVLGFMLAGLPGAFIVLVLGVLETSLSFDNAVVNASILQNWSKKWQDRFVTFGMPVAVFGMRFAFPLIIVGIVAHISPISAFTLAMHSPAEYAKILSSAHHEISAYGGMFLLMIFLTYFMDTEKEVHWIGVVEKPLATIGKLELQFAIATIFLMVVTHYVDAAEQLSFMMAGIAGLVTYTLAESFGTLVGGDEGDDTGMRIVKEGMMGLLYLELLDASFSFDGVMGAFAVSDNILIITLGLGIGAMFVRSMTLHLVETGKLAEYRYLEHGAFWAIGALAAITFIGVKHEVPDVVTGFIGAGLIGIALISSIIANRSESQSEIAEVQQN